MAFKYFKSSKRKRATDCSVRSIMAAENMSWEDAFSLLVKTAYKEQNMPSDSSVIEKTLKTIGYVKRTSEMVPFGKHRRRLTVEEFAKKHKKGIYILSVSGHVVCVKNGDWYDTWDSGEYKVFKYWEKL